jgi:hypothetical protein
LKTVRIVERKDLHCKAWKISHLPILHTMFFEQECFVEFSAVRNAKAKVIQPDPVGGISRRTPLLRVYAAQVQSAS